VRYTIILLLLVVADEAQACTSEERYLLALKGQYGDDVFVAQRFTGAEAQAFAALFNDVMDSDWPADIVVIYEKPGRAGLIQAFFIKGCLKSQGYMSKEHYAEILRRMVGKAPMKL
jgi:hypothetical protein